MSKAWKHDCSWQFGSGVPEDIFKEFSINNLPVSFTFVWLVWLTACLMICWPITPVHLVVSYSCCPWVTTVTCRAAWAFMADHGGKISTTIPMSSVYCNQSRTSVNSRHHSPCSWKLKCATKKTSQNEEFPGTGFVFHGRCIFSITLLWNQSALGLWP